MELTDRQELVLTAIRDHFLQYGFPPSLSELQDALNIGTKRGVVKHLIALEKKGFIIRTSEARGIRLVNEDVEEYDYLIGIPILGYANAGQPLATASEVNIGKLQLDKKMIPKNHELFSLIVKGDSMDQREINGTPIADGNYVVVSKDSEVRDGDAVVAIIDNCATIKTLKREKNMIILYPQSSNMMHRPIYLDSNSESFINGKVVLSLANPKIQ